MRFDDTIATVLALPADRPDRLAARWRQLVDLLAQHRAGADSATAAMAYEVLRGLRGSIDAETRRQSAEALAGRRVDPALVAFFAEDKPKVAAPLIAAARLDSAAWRALLPRLGPAARALLRHRADLDGEVRQGLAAFGRSDLVLEDQAAVPVQGESQIRELVERIEAYRKEKEVEPEAAIAADADVAHAFRWETGTDGIIGWVEGAPRAPLVGQSIAWVAGQGQYGVDGQAAGAFEKRSPFRDARFIIAGGGPAAGEWRISGIAFFDPVSGAFLGYRGTARRPRADESAAGAAADEGLFGTEFPADALRQLIHELRTPLNAIIGFAEMIEGQYMGPAAAPYRGRAAAIMEQARGLLGAVDDLDTAARIESRRLELGEEACDAAALLWRLHEAYARLAAERGARIELEIAQGLPPARLDPGAAERMIGADARRHDRPRRRRRDDRRPARQREKRRPGDAPPRARSAAGDRRARRGGFARSGLQPRGRLAASPGPGARLRLAARPPSRFGGGRRARDRARALRAVPAHRGGDSGRAERKLALSLPPLSAHGMAALGL